MSLLRRGCDKSTPYSVIPNRHFRMQIKCKLITCLPAPMHLHNQIIAISTLLSEKTLCTLRINRHLFNTRIANKLNKPVNIARKAMRKRLCPRQPDQCNFSTRKACTDGPQCRHSQQEIAQIQSTKDRYLPHPLPPVGRPQGPKDPSPPLPTAHLSGAINRAPTVESNSSTTSTTSSGEISRHGSPIGHSKR